MPNDSNTIANHNPVVNPSSTFPPTYLTVRQFSERHPAFSQGSLRSLIFGARRRHSSQGEISGNGLERALVKINTRVLINEAAFFAWVAERQGQ